MMMMMMMMMEMKILQVVEETQSDTEQHVNDSQDNRHLHLEWVQERQLVGGNVPYLRDKMVEDGVSDTDKTNITIIFKTFLKVCFNLEKSRENRLQKKFKKK